MAVNINTFKLLTEFIANKAQVGGTVSPSQFNMLANRAQMMKFEKDRNIFNQTGEISYFLDTFLNTVTAAVPGTGLCPYPTGYIQAASIRYIYSPPTGSAVQVPVQEISNKDWGMQNASQLKANSLEFPKYSEFPVNLRFLPITIASVIIDYFKLPVEPVWGYTVSVSGRPVYDAGTSTNFEWDDYSTDEIAGNYLSLIGCNLKDTELAQFSEMYKAQNSSIK